MIYLKKFFFDPNTIGHNIIDPIVFEKGLNIVLGERSDKSEKMNSVGKSLLVEMINYCLLSDSSSRILKIPENILPKETFMCLELELEVDSEIKKITIKRTREADKKILIDYDGNEKEFEKNDHAKQFIESYILNSENEINQPSFRNMISILIREEKSSYDDILRPYASKNYIDFSELIKPHLYLFGFDTSAIDSMKRILKKISENKITIKGLNKTFKDQGINTKTVRSYLNNLEETVNKLTLSIKNLKPGEGFIQKQSSLQNLESELEKLVVKRMAKILLARKIKALPKGDEVDSKKIEIIYNTFKQGLGTIVKKSLDEIQVFHEKINTFQNQLYNQHLGSIQKEIDEIDIKIIEKDTEISKIYASLKAGEKIEGLKITLKEEREKNSELERLSQKYNMLEEKNNEKKSLEKSKEDILDGIDKQIRAKKKEIREFEEDVIKLHNTITNNFNCQFDIKTSNQSEYIIIDYRIDLDGGSGTDRIRTFIYDVLLLLSKVTADRHYGFLIHDNIFPSTGRDDMVQALNFIYNQGKINNKFQYIVTLNKDEFEAQIKKFDFKSDEVTKAIFTRDTPFLKTPYREI